MYQPPRKNDAVTRLVAANTPVYILVRIGIVIGRIQRKVRHLEK